MSTSRINSLHHVLYTNAPGEDGQQGYRSILDYFDGEEEEAKTVVKWLNGLVETTREQGYGWAARPFVFRGARHAALAVLNPGFGLDDLNTTSVLSHALLVPIPNERPSDNFTLALYEEAKSFFLSVGQFLHYYLDGCKKRRSINVAQLDVAELKDTNLDFLRDFLVTAAHFKMDLSVREVSLSGIRTDKELPEMLARAGSFLPPPLRLAFCWATGVKPATERIVVHRRQDGGAPLGIQNVGNAYFEWLKERLAQHQFESIQEIAEDSSIISWEKLRERITGPAMVAEPVQGSSEFLVEKQKKIPSDRASDPISPKEKETMTAKRGQRSKPTDSSSPDNPADLRGFLQDEFVKMGESLRDYIDERLSRIGGLPVPPAESGGTAGFRPPASRRRQGTVRWFQAFRPEIYFFVVLLLLGGFYWKGFHQKIADNHQPEPSGPASNHRSPEAPAKTETPQVASQGQKADDFVAQWHDYLRTNQRQIAKLLTSITDPHSRVKVGSQTRASLEAWSKKLEKGQSLSKEEAAKTATALFEYIHAEWALLERQGNAKDNVVSLSTDEVTPEHLNAILQKYSLDFGPNPGRDDSNVQAAVVLKWLASQDEG